MRGSLRRSRHEEEEESAFVSMTDMTVSFLFIIMILLAFFVTHYSSEDRVPRSLVDLMRAERDDARRERDALAEEVARLVTLIEALSMQRIAARSERDDAIRRADDLDQKAAELQERLGELERQIETLRAPDPLEAYLTRAAAARLRILEELRDRIRADFPDLHIEISAESDALRFQGEGLFRTGEAALQAGPRQIVEAVASRLVEVLPCYTLGSRSSWEEGCNPGAAIIEALQIEGHTDSQGSEMNNLVLSTARANATFAAMLEREPDLTAYLNYRGQAVLSVAGYGQMRPVASNETVEGRATNRRIDLRIIMYTPVASVEIDRIRNQLARPAAAAPR